MKKRILAVDDSPSVRQMVKLTLSVTTISSVMAPKASARPAPTRWILWSPT